VLDAKGKRRLQKRRRRIGVRWGPVEEGRAERGEVTCTHDDLIMQQLIAHDWNDPTGSLHSFLAWVILSKIDQFSRHFF